MTGNLASLLFGDATVEEVEQASDGDNKVIAWINPGVIPQHHPGNPLGLLAGTQLGNTQTPLWISENET
jgi:hypothetical protein